MRFKNFINEAKPAGEIGHAKIEQQVPKAWNTYIRQAEPGEEVKDEQFVSNVGTSIEGSLPQQRLEFVGSGMTDKIRISDYWYSYTKSKMGVKPKTDFHTEDEETKISFKKSNGSALLFSGKNESLATFHAAFDEFRIDENSFKQLTDYISEKMSDIIKVEDTIKNVKNRVKKGEDINELDSRILNIDKAHGELKNILAEFFENNKTFNMYFIKEAMSGAYKFKDTPIGAANHIMSSKPTGESKIRKIDFDLCKRVVDQGIIRLDVAFKTSRDNAWSAIKLLLDPNKEEQVFDHFIRQYNEGIITEGVLFDKITTFIKEMIPQWVKKVVTQLIEAIKKGFDAFMQFMGVQLQSVDAKETKDIGQVLLTL